MVNVNLNKKSDTKMSFFGTPDVLKGEDGASIPINSCIDRNYSMVSIPDLDPQHQENIDELQEHRSEIFDIDHGNKDFRDPFADPRHRYAPSLHISPKTEIETGEETREVSTENRRIGVFNPFGEGESDNESSDYSESPTLPRPI
jgi:hypothetical protein